MNLQVKRAACVLIGVSALALAFLAGRWSEGLQTGLRQETDYPWDLHRKIGQAGIDCSLLSANPSAGRFRVRPLDDGATLIVASQDRSTGKVTAFALEGSGRMAADTWTADCPR
ncbi:MAG TPA: hypothetical protein VFY73_06690 [Ideonella sp.]|uniref:hypothetical protein n=1 Tax=Ideonella sp. TaxID=1929293 RepID=UPI002E2F50FF|nr:hypothetical protein [Ideonella sp.]HEX5683709.1 hypothetical protein [Ideonella sp.]